MEYIVSSHDPSQAIMYASGFAAMVYAGFKFIQARTSPLCAIPTVGYSGVLTSYITAFQYISNGPGLLQEGYEKFEGKPFKVATLARWLVVLGEQYIPDLSGASDEVVSSTKPVIENNQVDYTFGRELLEDPYHVITLRGPVTRNLESRYEDINDEVVHSLQEYIPPDKDWITVVAYDTLLHIISRSTNRFLLGLKLCRNSRYQNLSERFTHEVVEAGTIINRFPSLFRPIAGYFTPIKNTVKECREILGPLITERLKQYEQTKSVSKKAGDMEDVISWFIETSTKEYHRTLEDITRRVMMTNVASLHASAMVLTQVMYDLAIYPEYAKELREELETVIAEHGWTRRAMHKLSKLDSFLKESHRINGISHYLMIRETLKDFKLSDGTIIPAGNHVGIAAGAINMSEKHYDDPNTFKGFRFAEMRAGDDELEAIKYQMVSLSPYSVMFGHGRHACPGRFLAVTLVKTVFAHILLDYDVQLENGSMERPPDIQDGVMSIPNPQAKLRFRKRSCVS